VDPVSRQLLYVFGGAHECTGGDARPHEQYAVFCSRFFSRVNRGLSHYFAGRILLPRMTGSLFDHRGVRKYLVASERHAFVGEACRQEDSIAAFCLTLAVTGARISEALSLTIERIDEANGSVVFRTLKQRNKTLFRAVPVPRSLIRLLLSVQPMPCEPVWSWGRTTAWKVVKSVMRNAGIADGLCKPKALRHAFAIEAGQNGVPLNIVQRWLGHARIETTAIYAGALGEEERSLARRSWKSIDETVTRQMRSASQPRATAAVEPGVCWP
jgi:integrase